MTHLKKPSLFLLICLVGLPQISETIYSPALPAVATGLHTSNTLVQWTLSIYFIGFALGVFAWGYLSDKIGRRPAMLLGLTTYIVGSFACFMAPSIHLLSLARLVQAFGIATGSVVTQAIMRESFDNHERHKLFATISVALAIAPALGPVIGGYISEYLGWRENFLALVTLGLLVFAYSWNSLIETKLDSQSSINAKQLLATAWRMICDKHIIGSILIIGTINGIIFSYYAEAPFIFIDSLHLTSDQFGWLGLVIAAATVFGGIMSRKVSASHVHLLPRIGGLLMVISCVIMLLVSKTSLVSADHPLLSTVCLMLPMALLIFASFGLVLPKLLSIALKDYHDVLGTAGAILGLAYYLLIAAFTWGIGVLHTGSMAIMPSYFLVLSVITLISTIKLVQAD